jgi:hypothetical protein
MRRCPAHRQSGAPPDGDTQCAADAHRAAGIDDGDTSGAEDEADVGDVIMAWSIERELLAEVHEYSGGDLADRQRVLGASGRCPGERTQQSCAQAQARELWKCCWQRCRSVQHLNACRRLLPSCCSRRSWRRRRASWH